MKTKSERGPIVRAPEYVEARIRRDLRLTKEKLALFELSSKTKSEKFHSEIRDLETELSEMKLP